MRNGGKAWVETDFVQAPTNVNGRRLNGAINDLWKWCQEVRGVDFRIEEYFRGEEALVSNIYRVLLPIKVSRW